MVEVVARLRKDFFGVDSWMDFDSDQYRLFEMPWFTRRWILQEISLACAATVYCGQHRIRWYNLAVALGIIYVESEVSALFAAEVARIVEIWSSVYLGGLFVTPTRLFEILCDFQYFDCSGDRDRLFSIFGFVNSRAWQLTANYNHSILEAYTTFAGEWLEAANKPELEGLPRWSLRNRWNYETPFHFLDLAGYNRLSQDPRMETLPSWVPDWRIVNHPPTIALLDNSELPKKLKKHTYHFGNSMDKLYISGYLLDTIKGTEDPANLIESATHVASWGVSSYRERLGIQGLHEACGIDHNCSPQRQQQAHCRWLRVIAQERTMTEPYQHGSALQVWEAFARALIAFVPGSLIKEENVSQLYQAWSTDWLSRELSDEEVRHKILYSRRPSFTSIEDTAQGYARLFGMFAPGRTIFTTHARRIGLGPFRLEKGDHIVNLLGARTPHVLRPVEGQENKFRLIGQAYVQGIMRGDMESLITESNSVQKQEFCLI